MRKGYIISILSVILATALSILLPNSESYLSASAAPFERPTVIIDAGHAALENTIKA